MYELSVFKYPCHMNSTDPDSHKCNLTTARGWKLTANMILKFDLSGLVFHQNGENGGEKQCTRLSCEVMLMVIVVLRKHLMIKYDTLVSRANPKYNEIFPKSSD